MEGGGCLGRQVRENQESVVQGPGSHIEEEMDNGFEFQGEIEEQEP